MNIKVGEYIRTKDGIIAKCIEEKQDRYVFNKIVLEQGYYNNYILKDIPERANFITNHSKNIINLVEIGDFVNNSKIIEIEEYNNEKYVYVEEIEFCNACDENENVYYKEEDIKSIVTKQQFNNIKYKV